MPSRTRLLLCVAALAVTATAVYAPNLDDYFVGDDFDLISSFYDQPPRYFFELLYSNESGVVWDSPGETYTFIRPLKIWLLKLDLMLWGTNPLGFHLTAAALFAASVVLVFLVLRTLFPGMDAAAFLGAWIVAVHPIFAYIVPTITFREETLALSLGLAVFLFFLRHRLEDRSAIGFYVAYALGLLTKESAVVFMGPALAYDAIQGVLWRRDRSWWVTRARTYLPVVLILLGYLSLRAIAFGPSLTEMGGEGYFSAEKLRIFHTHFFVSLIGPKLNAFHSTPAAAGLALVLVSLAVALLVMRRKELGREYFANLLVVGPAWYLAMTAILHSIYLSFRHNATAVTGLAMFLAAVFAGATSGLGRRSQWLCTAVAISLCAAAFLPPTLRESRTQDAASDSVERVRARIELETRELPPGSTVLIRNVPPYSHAGLLSALKLPFTQSDLANRSEVINEREILMKTYPSKVPARFDQVVILKNP